MNLLGQYLHCRLHRLVGSIHSHPSPSHNPSGADLALFGKYGRIHIIVGYPYNMSTWKAYDLSGKEVILEVI